jgi:hypothetical protein
MTSAILHDWPEGWSRQESRGGRLPQAPGVALFDRPMEHEARRWPLAAGGPVWG